MASRACYNVDWRGNETTYVQWRGVTAACHQAERSGAKLDVTLVDRATGGADTTLRDKLRFTVSLNGAVLPGLSNVSYSAVSSAIMGSTVPAGQGGVLTIGVTVPDQGTEAANNALAGKTAAIQAKIHAQSID